MINKQNYSTLKLFIELEPNLQKIVLQNCSKELIRFICECCANIVQGHFQNLRKQDLVNYENNLQKLLSKKTLLREKRFLLASHRGIELIELIANQLIKEFEV